MLRTGQTIKITLENLAYGGDAVGHHQGQAIFVPYGVPGDEIKVKITEPHKSYCRGRIYEIINPSGHRIKPTCAHFGSCGSCQWQMMSYDYQLTQKLSITREIFKRLGGMEIDEVEALSHSTGWAYRNKAQCPVQPGGKSNLVGYYRPGSHIVEDIDTCPLLVSRMDQVFRTAKDIINDSGLKGYNEPAHSGSLRHLIFRYSSTDDALSLVLVTRYQPDLHRIADRILSRLPSVRSVWQNVNRARGNTVLGDKWIHLGGEEYLSERIGGIRYRLSPGSFLQSNLEMTGTVYRKIEEHLQLSSGQTVADLYSGMGSIALQLAGKAKRVTGIEEFGPAVEDAEANAELNGIENCRFLRGRTEDQLGNIKTADAVVLDPPRQGAGPEVIGAIIRLNPTRIAYLSCNPSTLARDAAGLASGGYKLHKIFLADMFPQTYHIENLAIFTR